MTKARIAIFASGTGSNFQAIMDYKDLACDVVLLVCDRKDAEVINKANTYGIPTFQFDPKAFPSKKAYEQKVVDQLQKEKVTWIFLAGYMRLVGVTLLQAYEGKIVNIHPSLLPDFTGIDAIGQALRAKVKTTGVTVHYIDEGMDTGPIIAQEAVDILRQDTMETLQKRIQQIEHRLYPRVINNIVKATK